MAVDMFLEVKGPDVAGESKDKAHGGKIDILAWSWSMSNSGTTHMGGGSGSGKSNFNDIAFTCYYEKSTHELMKGCAQGTHYEEMILTCRKAGDKPLEYITYKLTECLITSVSTGGSGGEDRLTVNFTVNFGKFDIMYKEQDKKGAEAAQVPYVYNIMENAAE